MKIAIIAGPYVPIPPIKYGGTEQVVFNLIEGLKELGHVPILFGPADSQVDCKIIPVVEKAINFGLDSQQQKEVNERVLAIEQTTKLKLLENLDQVDFIHSHGFDLKDFQNFPNLTTIHGQMTMENIDYFSNRRDLYFVSISKNQQHSFPNLQYVGVVYNGLNHSKFNLVKKPEDYLCFLGRFDREKNPHLAIQMALKLGIKIKLGGKIDFQGKDYFEQEIKPFLDNPLVEFLGELNLEQKIDLISHARCNLHPTGFREPFGLSVLESAYCGTPTMAISRGSMPELIEDGRTGVLVEDFIEGFHSIKDCFEMDRSYISLRAKSLFNYKTMSKQYVLAYQKVIEIHRAKTEKNNQIQRILENTKSDLEKEWQSRFE